MRGAQGPTPRHSAGALPWSPRASWDWRCSRCWRLRSWGEQLALYRRLKRSSLALWVAVNYRPGGNSFWPGMETALKRDLDEDDACRWKLAGEILTELAREAYADGVSSVVLVDIPYLAQVYDDIWASSFGSQPARYDRKIGDSRLKAICDAAGMVYVDTTPRFVEEARRRGHWLHFREDGQPTAEGQLLIAETLADALR